MLLGEKLRQARVAQGLDISVIAAQLKIQSRYLAAIEAAQRDQVPSAFLFKSWVRQYADALGVDYGELKAEVEEMVNAEAPLPLPGQDQWTAGRLSYPSMHRRDGVYRLAYSLVMLAVAIAGGSEMYAHRDALFAQLRLLPASVQANARHALSPEVPASQAERQANPPAPAVLLEIYAREQTWISISPDGKQVFSGVLLANQSRSVRAQQSALLKIGNAGGLEVRLNGNPVGEIGPRGRIRILIVSPEGVKIVNPKSVTKSADPTTV